MTTDASSAWRERIRYVVVGLLNTAIDFGVYAALLGSLGIFTANLVSTSVAMAFSFLMHGKFTFRRERLDLRHAVLFVTTTCTTMWLVVPLVIHAVVWLGGGALLGKALSMAASVVLNYVTYRFIVFRDRTVPLAVTFAKVSPHEELK